MTESVDWLPVLVVLAAGLGGGFLLVRLSARGGAAPAPANPLVRRDLLARRDALLAQLREMHAMPRPTSGSAPERAALEHEAAVVLRDLDRLEAGSPLSTDRSERRDPPRAAAESTPPPVAAPGAAGLRGFLWGTGTATAMALLLFFVSRAPSERAPGGSPTGGSESGGSPKAEASGRGAAGDTDLASLQEAVRHNPDDVEARLGLARVLLDREDLMQVYEQTKAVLERSPGHPRALTYQAIVRMEMGQLEAAERMLRQALGAEPDLLDAYVQLAFVHARSDRLDQAEADIKEATRRHPEETETLRGIWTEVTSAAKGARSRLAQADAGDDPHRSVPIPAMTQAAAPGPAAHAPDDGREVAGSLELDPGLQKTLAAGAIVFVTVRTPGAKAGPPLAAKRLSASSFPLAFRVGTADSMMGAPLPDRVRLDARVDADGDPLTRGPDDPSASADGVALGTSGLRLVLRTAR